MLDYLFLSTRTVIFFSENFSYLEFIKICSYLKHFFQKIIHSQDYKIKVIKTDIPGEVYISSSFHPGFPPTSAIGTHLN